VARAQQPTIPTVGYVHSDSPQTVANLLAAFREGLSEIGYIEGQNVAIETGGHKTILLEFRNWWPISSAAV
jgi:hypothetical protein